jgi:hypothetical protein
MSDSRAGFSGTDPGVPGGDRSPAPWLRPRGLPAGKASRIHRGLGQAGRHTGARAGSPLRTSQGHQDNRAAPVATRWHRDNPGRPGQHA